MNESIDITLNDISFGDINGEDESQNKNFSQLFFTGNNKYQELMGSKNFIISGRKGTGKTILAKYIESVKHNPEKMVLVSYEKLKELEFQKNIERELHDTEDLSNNQFRTFSSFFILCRISETILNNKLKLKYFFKNDKFSFNSTINYFKYKKFYKRLKSILKERYTDDNYSIPSINTNLELTLSNELSHKKKRKLFYKKSNSEQKAKCLKDYCGIYPTLKSIVLDLLNFVHVIIIFDDIENIHDCFPDNFTFQKFVSNFIYDMQELNSNMKDSKCILAIRDDILQSLNSVDQNINKIIVGSNVSLDWNRDVIQLKHMIINKIKLSNELLKNISDEEIYNHFFSNNRNNNRKKNNNNNSYETQYYYHDNPKDVFETILSNTFCKPRDIICYLNIIKKQFGNSQKIKYSHFRQTSSEYSEYFWGELKNEIIGTYSQDFLIDLELLLSHLENSYFTYTHFTECFENLKPNFKEISRSTPEEILKILYNFSIVGIYRTPQNTNQKDWYDFKYKNSSNKNINLNIFSKKNYNLTIHNGLIKVFNLEQKKPKR